MKIGMLWYNNDPKITLTDKIAKAAAYYQQKYGQSPDLCFVHPSMVKDAATKAGGVELRTSRSVRPNHFWIGLNGE
jgi:hypothetical protein